MSDTAEEFHTPDRPPYWYEGRVSPNPTDSINRLIVVNRDGAEGYEAAAEILASTPYEPTMRELSQQRSDFVKTLSAEVVNLGGSPAQASQVKGMLHRVWMDIRAALAAKEGKAVLNECVRGDEAAISVYEDVLLVDLPENLRPVLNEQLDKIRLAKQQLEKAAND